MAGLQPHADPPHRDIDLLSFGDGRLSPPLERTQVSRLPISPHFDSTSQQLFCVVWHRLTKAIRTPTVLLFIGVYSALAIVFYFVPEMDLGFSSYFYTPGQGFAVARRSSTTVLPLLPWITIAFCNGILYLLIRNLVAWQRNKKSPQRAASVRRLLFLLLTLICGPGLTINLFLKQQWGRSRPYQVEAYGGKRQFTAAFVTTGECTSNCSFVSGDASMGYFLIAFYFIARKRRWAIALAAYALGSALGLIRIAQGAHFLSDVVSAGFFTILVAWILHLAILDHPQNSSPAQR